jgi:poly(hydroxyalkanoate) granule-associated protein
MAETPEKRTLVDFFERIYGQAQTSVATAEEELGKAVGRLTDAATGQRDEARRQIRELSERVVGQRKEFERTVDEKVRRALERFRLPRRDEIKGLNERLDALTKRLERLKP